MTRPVSTRDLKPSERRFVSANTELQFGRYERVRIQNGELILDPWPSTVRHVKFGISEPPRKDGQETFELKKQVADFFEFVRTVDAGTIRVLQISSGLPVAMEIEEGLGAAVDGQHS